MFQKFFRVKGTEKKAIGTGLGLSICKQIVQGHNGRIEVKSKVNEGTAFILHFPRHAQN
jgi:signal transduction histidine kinase